MFSSYQVPNRPMDAHMPYHYTTEDPFMPIKSRKNKNQIKKIIKHLPYFFYIFDHAKYSITFYFFQNNYFLCF